MRLDITYKKIYTNSKVVKLFSEAFLCS